MASKAWSTPFPSHDLILHHSLEHSLSPQLPFPSKMSFSLGLRVFSHLNKVQRWWPLLAYCWRQRTSSLTAPQFEEHGFVVRTQESYPSSIVTMWGNLCSKSKTDPLSSSTLTEFLPAGSPTSSPFAVLETLLSPNRDGDFWDWDIKVRIFVQACATLFPFILSLLLN